MLESLSAAGVHPTHRSCRPENRGRMHFLDIEDMIALRGGTRCGERNNVFLAAKEEGRYPVLRGLAQGSKSFPEITVHIDTILDRYGKIKDSASPELYTIRRTIRDREGQVSKRVAGHSFQGAKDGYADADAAVSIRATVGPSFLCRQPTNGKSTVSYTMNRPRARPFISNR